MEFDEYAYDAGNTLQRLVRFAWLRIRMAQLPSHKGCSRKVDACQAALPLSAVSRETSQTATAQVLLPSCSHDWLVQQTGNILYSRLPASRHQHSSRGGHCRELQNRKRGARNIFTWSCANGNTSTPRRNATGRSGIFTGQSQPGDPLQDEAGQQTPSYRTTPSWLYVQTCFFLGHSRRSLSHRTGQRSPRCAQGTCNIKSARPSHSSTWSTQMITCRRIALDC
ncbi:hypothetical protein GE09DRAFT_74304 [Coniochaeta sp. 2T2.1]|nr:hypothetical protein GE09DRAFT_74304 [Coniochaeta sp. 2T2.1]